MRALLAAFAFLVAGLGPSVAALMPADAGRQHAAALIAKQHRADEQSARVALYILDLSRKNSHVPDVTRTQFFTGGIAAVGGPSCPFQNTASADGCTAALAAGGQNIDPTFFTDIAQSGQTYVNSHPPQYNLPGIDYAIGMETPLSNKQDPAAGGLPTGCTYFAPAASQQWASTSIQTALEISADGGSTITFPGIVICNTGAAIANGISTGVPLPGANAPITLRNFRWDATGGHSCTFLASSSNVSTNLLDIVDDYFSPDANCSNNLVNSAAQLPGLIYAIRSAITVPILIEHSTFIGNWIDVCCSEPKIAGNTPSAYNFNASPSGVAAISLRDNANITLSYDYVAQFPNIVMEYLGNAASTNLQVDHTYIRDIGNRIPAGHVEFISGGPAQSITYQYFVFAQGNGACACGDAPINVMNAAGGLSGNLLLDNGVIITNLIAGTNTRTSTFAGSFTSAPGGGAPGIFTISSVTSGNVAPGANDSNNLILAVNQSGAGVGSTWAVDCAISTGGTWCPKVGSGQSAYNTDGLTVGGALITTVLSGAWQNVVTSAAVDFDTASISGTATISNMWLDLTGAGATGSISWKATAATCASPVVFSNNLSLLDGVTTYNAFQSGQSGGSGC